MRKTIKAKAFAKIKEGTGKNGKPWKRGSVLNGLDEIWYGFFVNSKTEAITKIKKGDEFEAECKDSEYNGNIQWNISELVYDADNMTSSTGAEVSYEEKALDKNALNQIYQVVLNISGKLDDLLALGYANEKPALDDDPEVEAIKEAFNGTKVEEEELPF